MPFIDKIQDLMRGGIKKLSKITENNNLGLKLDWEKISALETSLRKFLTQEPQLIVNHHSLQILIKSAKQIIRVIDVIRAQQKNYISLQQNYNLMQSKLNNHENIITNLEKSHLERLKSITDENRMAKQHFQKAKRQLVESQEQAKQQAIEIKKENNQLKFKVEVLVKEKQELLKLEEQKEYRIKDLEGQIKRLKDTIFTSQQPPKPKQNSQNPIENIICSNIGPKLVSYLYPQDICSLYFVSKKSYLFLIKSQPCQTATFNSILGFKNNIIRYYHKHIDYFQKLFMKIPQQILQLAFYRYEIVKQVIGTDILQTLNRSAMLFEGKFVEEGEDIQLEDKEQDFQIKEEQISKQLDKVEEYNRNARQDIEEMTDFNEQQQIYKKIENQIHTILEIDPDIVKQFLYEQKSQRIKVQKDIDLMYKKIQDTAQLYSADVQSIGMFLKNVLKNFSKVFVLSKNLYTECRNLQSLNTFILKQLSNWQKIQVKYTSQIQDLKAQLQAESKLKFFFSGKCLKSQQKALNQQNIKLTIESKYNKQTQKLDQICRQKEELSGKLESTQKNLKTIQGQYKEVKKAYQSAKQKYKKIIEELVVVKETILRMNVM